MGIFGKALLDYQNGNTNAEIIVHSPDFEPDSIPVEHLLRPYDAMPDVEQLALQKCVGSVLDVGACAGAHSHFLQQQGFDVTALEIDEDCCTYLRAFRGIKNVHCGDFLNYTTSTKYDTLLLLMNGSGFAGTIDNFESFIAHCETFLNPGGQILMDSSDLVYLYELEDGSLELPMHKYYGEMQYQVEYKGEKSTLFDWLYIDFELLEEKLSTLGWKVDMLLEQNNLSYLVKIYK